MRTYGRTYDANGIPTWQVVESTPDTGDDIVWAVTLIQTLKLNLNESPFYATYGVPYHASVVQQVAPDFYAVRIQQQFSQYFANLVISRVPGATEPTYRVNVTTHQGVKLTGAKIPQ